MPLAARLEEIYSVNERYALPYIGAAYSEPRADELRVMAVGINSYVSARDWPPHPTWLVHWFEQRSYRFQRGAFKAASELASALTQPPAMFQGLTFDPKRGVLATNAIKVFMREAEGKRAEQLNPAHFREHVPQWREELHALADAGVMPHMVLILGAPFWEHAWQAFHPEHHDWSGAARVTDFRAAWGDAPHRANRVALEIHGRQHDLLLVRLRHPAGRSREGSVPWLLGRRAFRELVGLPESLSGLGAVGRA